MAYFKETNLHQDGPDIRVLGIDWQRCQHKALPLVRTTGAFSLGDMRAPGPGAKSLLCEVGCVACPLRTVLGDMAALKL